MVNRQVRDRGRVSKAEIDRHPASVIGIDFDTAPADDATARATEVDFEIGRRVIGARVDGELAKRLNVLAFKAVDP